MKIFNLTENNFEELILKCANALAQKGTFLLIPTETVYGFVCSWNDDTAIKKIYEAKGRDENKPFQMLASDVNMVKTYGGEISNIAGRVANEFCPGPITIVIPSSSGSTIGFRVPEHRFALELIRKCNFPLAGTSANLSGEPPALFVEDALKKLVIRPNIAINSGKIPLGSKPSTVIKIDKEKIELLREGPISIEDIKNSIGKC